MTVKEMRYHYLRRADFDTGASLYSQNTSGLEFLGDGLKPHTTVERTCTLPTSEYVLDADVATAMECKLTIWWIKYDKKGADWGDRFIERHFLDEHEGSGSINASDMYAKGYIIEIVGSKNPF